jgi:hypothetical protein
VSHVAHQTEYDLGFSLRQLVRKESSATAAFCFSSSLNLLAGCWDAGSVRRAGSAQKEEDNTFIGKSTCAGGWVCQPSPQRSRKCQPKQKASTMVRRASHRIEVGG